MDETLISQYAGCSLEELPEDVRTRIEADPQTLDVFLSQHQIARLLVFKRYEVPDPALEGRVVYKVSTRIRNGEVSRSLSLPWRGMVFPEWARMLAVVVVMLVLSVWTHREMLHSNEREMNGDPGIALLEAGYPPSPVTRGETLQMASLVHEDAFTTRVPQFHVSLEPLRFPSEFANLGDSMSPEIGPSALSTNEWSAPFVMPVRFSPLRD